MLAPRPTDRMPRKQARTRPSDTPHPAWRTAAALAVAILMTASPGQAPAQVDLPEPLAPPRTAAGLFLTPTTIERLDLNQSNGIHDRRHFELSAEGWVQSVLVP